MVVVIMSKHVVVIGAGVIGLSTAYALIKAGQQVTLLESATAVAMQTSYANGGQLSYRYVSPLADVGVPLQGLAWMGKSDSPLNLKLHACKQQLSWLAAFTLACNRKANKINGDNILRLSLLSQKTMSTWRNSGDIGSFAWQKTGKMIVYRDAKSFQKASASIDTQFQQILNPQEISALEPSLSHIEAQLKGAVYAPEDETADCYLFCCQLQKYLAQQPGFRLLNNHEVKGFKKHHDRIASVITGQGEIACDEVVISAGNGSRKILHMLHMDAPILGLKGYSLSLPFPQEANIVPSISVTDYGHKTVYAKLNDTLRIAAMVDIGYDQEGLRDCRIQALKKTVAQTFPKLTSVDDAMAWSGLRPSTPKGPPILGRSAIGNVWLNIGHGSLGFTLAAGSASVIAALICQKASPISLTGLTG